jgi:cysteinyl-tRNA synthetase
VNYWVHGEFLVLDNGKMSKSRGSFLTVSKLVEEGYSPIDYRYFCLQSKYRKQLTFSFESLTDAQRSLSKLRSRIKNILDGKEINEKVANSKLKEYQDRFKTQISDDLNIANAFTVLFDVIKDTTLNSAEKIYLIEDFDKVFSLNLTESEDSKDSSVDVEYIEQLIQERSAAKTEKNWTKADEIRNMLLENNIELVDSKECTIWKIK